MPEQSRQGQRGVSSSNGGQPTELANTSGMWRSSNEIQDRVKKAIEKSMGVIKKFKELKDNMQG